MLICPKCQFDKNPDLNKFCQSCGTSLTHKVCPQCSSDVTFSEQKCHNCGAATATVWWAIISETRDSESEKLPSLPTGAYLDQQQRYQLLAPLSPPEVETAAPTQVQVKVLDCQPFQLSPLEVDTEIVIATKMPAIARAYLTLQSQFPNIVPTIHDAWQQKGMQVVLVTNRSDWQMLTDLWREPTTSHLQIWQWLSEITELWQVLKSWRCRQSLLDLENLRVSPMYSTLGEQSLLAHGQNHSLALQRLDAEPETQESLTLKDLAKLWQSLFQQSQRTLFGPLIEILQDLKLGNIQTVDNLRSRLQAVGNELQANVTNNLEQLPTTANHSSSLSPPTSQMNESQPLLIKSDDLPTLILPMQLVSIESASRTDVGRQRDRNEDFFGVETKINTREFPNNRTLEAQGIYILCDGMGGHAGGEVASSLAVQTLLQYFQTNWQQRQLPAEATIREGVRLANQALYDLNQQDARAGVGRMGTTLVMVLVQDTQVAVAHVGDSRLYRLTRKLGLHQITEDHEVGQREISLGVEREIAYARPDAYQLTQALGPRDANSVNPDVEFLELNEDTLLLLVSDGLSDNDLLEHHWQTHLEPLLSSATNLERGVSELINLANHYNGHDNITALAIRFKVSPKQEQQI